MKMDNQSLNGRVRLATLEDADEILAIYAPYIEQTTISFEWTVPTPEAFRARMKQSMEDYPYIVYEENGVILGYAYAHRAFERYSYRFCAELSVYIKQDARVKGIGTLLYRILIDLCREMGIKTLYGVVTNPNEASFRLHERLGFVRVGNFPNSGHKFDQWIDVIWYALPIGEYEPHPREITPFSQLSKTYVSLTLTKYLN